MQHAWLLAPVLFVSLLTACSEDNNNTGAGGAGQGGDAAGGDAQGGNAQGGGSAFTLSVDVAGLLTSGLAVSLNGEETLTIDADGTHAFTTSLADGASFDVSATSPRGEACVVSMGTGTIAGADATAEVTCAPVVTAVYDAAPSWNDYLDSGGTAACDTTSAIGYDSCIHGGEQRFVFVPGATNCTDITATDALGAFLWECDDSEMPVRVRTRALADDKGLTDLIDFSTIAWRSNSVTIAGGSGPIHTTDAGVWWSNPVTSDTNGGSLDAASTIYAASSATDVAWTIDADRVALVVAPGSSLTTSGADYGLTAIQRTHFWFEGAADATNGPGAMYLEDVAVSVIRGATFVGDGSTGVELRDSPMIAFGDSRSARRPTTRC